MPIIMIANIISFAICGYKTQKAVREGDYGLAYAFTAVSFVNILAIVLSIMKS